MNREGNWKYVFFTWFDDLLFDLAEDPGEFSNRIGDPQARAVEQEMIDILNGQIDPEAVTREAFRAQDQVLKRISAGKTEDQIAQALEKRLGRGLARVLAARCKAQG